MEHLILDIDKNWNDIKTEINNYVEQYKVNPWGPPQSTQLNPPLPAERQNQNLRGKDAQKHGERVYGWIADRGSIAWRQRVGVGEQREACPAAGQHAHQSKVIKFGKFPCKKSYDNQRKQRYQKSAKKPQQTVFGNDGFNKFTAGANAHARQEQANAYFPQH